MDLQATLHSNGVLQYNYQLYIHDAIKEDEGSYACYVEYQIQDTRYIEEKQFNVSIQNYLPSRTYPKCSMSPSPPIVSGAQVTFDCIIGESNAIVGLRLELQRDNGSVVRLGEDKSIVYTVTDEEINSIFICHMTSETFLKAYRNCSMPITPQTNSTPHTPYSKNTTINPLTAFIVSSIVVMVFVIAIGVVCICLKSRNNPPASNQLSPSPVINCTPRESDPQPYAVSNVTNLSTSITHSYMSCQRDLRQTVLENCQEESTDTYTEPHPYAKSNLETAHDIIHTYMSCQGDPHQCDMDQQQSCTSNNHRSTMVTQESSDSEDCLYMVVYE